MVQVRVTELQAGDQIGPSDVTLPITQIVIGVPERTPEEIAARSALALRVRSPEGVESIFTPLPSARVFVRRYVARATRTRGDDGTVDPVVAVVMFRTLVGTDALAMVDADVLRLRTRDHLSLVAA